MDLPRRAVEISWGARRGGRQEQEQEHEPLLPESLSCVEGSGWVPPVVEMVNFSIVPSWPCFHGDFSEKFQNVTHNLQA